MATVARTHAGASVLPSPARLAAGGVAGTLIGAGLGFGFRRTVAAARQGAIAGAVAGAAVSASSAGFPIEGSHAAQTALVGAGVLAAAGAAILPGFKGMPVSPVAIGFELGIAGLVGGGIIGGVWDLLDR